MRAELLCFFPFVWSYVRTQDLVVNASVRDALRQQYNTSPDIGSLKTMLVSKTTASLVPRRSDIGTWLGNKARVQPESPQIIIICSTLMFASAA